MSISLIKKLFLICLLFKFSITISQEVKNENYIPIKCIGKVPDFFTLDISTRIGTEKIEKNNDKKIAEAVTNFNIKTAYQTDILFHSGRIVYGDSITLYLNDVLKLIIDKNPQLNKNLQIYTYKSSSVNAFTLPSGVIGFNIGLLAKAKTEAEIAMVICHEIIHYQKKHALNELVENYEIIGGTGKKSRKNYDENIDKLYIKSKEKEIEADSLGLVLFLNTNYNPIDARNLFKTLYFDELPIEEIVFNKAFFDINDFKLPSSYYLNEVIKIGEIKEEIDRFATHPDIKKRLSAFDKQVANSAEKGNQANLLPNNAFYNTQKLASLELVRLYLMSRNYGNCIYHSYCLLQKYPNMEYLWLSVAKSLYGLSKYKNEDEYHRAAKQYAKFAGESQQIHYVLRQFDKKQLNVFAIKHLLMIQKKYPENQHLTVLINDLFYDLVVISELTKNNFNTEYKQEKNERLFYKNAFVNEFNDTLVLNYFKKFEKVLDEKKKKENLTLKELSKIDKIKKDSIKKFGYQISADNLIVLSPKVIYAKKDFTLDYIKADSLQKIIEKELINAIKSTNFKHIYLDKNQSVHSVDVFNETSTILEWFQEIYSHGEIKLFTSLTDEMKQVAEKKDMKYLLYTNYYYAEGDKKSYYELLLFNISTEKIIYTNAKTNKKTPNQKDANKFINQSLKTIKT